MEEAMKVGEVSSKGTMSSTLASGGSSRTVAATGCWPWLPRWILRLVELKTSSVDVRRGVLILSVKFEHPSALGGCKRARRGREERQGQFERGKRSERRTENRPTSTFVTDDPCKVHSLPSPSRLRSTTVVLGLREIEVGERTDGLDEVCPRRRDRRQGTRSAQYLPHPNNGLTREARTYYLVQLTLGQGQHSVGSEIVAWGVV